MDEQKTNTPASTPSAPKAPAGASRPPMGGGFSRGGPRGGTGGGARGGSGRGAGKPGDKRGGGRPRPERVKPEYDQKSIEVRRVARVVAGGRRFSFSVAMIIGDRKGKVGVGTGKAGDISNAMDKAAKDAKKHMITVKLTKTHSIPHEVSAKASSAYIQIMPAPSRGLVAGSAVRNALELAGITDVSAKIWSGSKNKLNMARATVKALQQVNPRHKTADKAEAKTEASAEEKKETPEVVSAAK